MRSFSGSKIYEVKTARIGVTTLSIKSDIVFITKSFALVITGSITSIILSLKLSIRIHYANEAAKNEGWLLDRHANYPTTDLEIKNIVSSSIVYSKLNKIYDVIQAQYNVPSNILKATDLFLVRYDSNLQNKLKKHKDGSEFSFIIALNNDFTGGGTCINKTINKLDTGKCLIFCGQNRHSGIKINSGTRYIVAGFIEIIDRGFCGDRYELAFDKSLMT